MFQLSESGSCHLSLQHQAQVPSSVQAHPSYPTPQVSANDSAQLQMEMLRQVPCLTLEAYLHDAYVYAWPQELSSLRQPLS